MKHLFILDQVVTIKKDSDTSFLLIDEAVRRGHQVDLCEIKDLAYKSGLVTANGTKVSSYDVVWLRKDPPIDQTYVEHLQLLATVKDVFFVNNPLSVLELNEKLSILHFPEYIPETIVTKSKADLLEFRAEYQDIVIKPLNGFSGQGVKRVGHKDEISEPTNFVMAQRFLPEVFEGDTRIHIAGGQIVGSLRRRPAEGNFLVNIHAGGSPHLSELSPELIEMGETIGNFLMKKKIFFSGIDVIGNRLNEINVTSPGILRETNQVSGQQVEVKIFDLLEKHV